MRGRAPLQQTIWDPASLRTDLCEEEAVALSMLVLAGDEAGQVATQGGVHQHRQVLVCQAHLRGALALGGRMYKVWLDSLLTGGAAASVAGHH